MDSGGFLKPIYDRGAGILRWFVASVIAVTLAASCSEEEKKLAKLAQGCLINSDCDAPLVCAFQRCHNACESTRDCPPGLRCVSSDGPLHVCQLEEERSCVYNSQCPEGQVCASDAQCRDMCMGQADCLKEQLCVAGSCAEPSELRDGGLPVADKEGGPSTGQPCSYNTECPDRLVCRMGLCQLECLSSVDCSEGRQCVQNRCVVPLCPEVDAGSGISCGFSSDCPSGLVCRSGACTCECRVGADCPAGYDCVNSRCSPGRVDSIGPEGGIVVSPDRRLTLEVPAGALAYRVHLTIELAEAWPAGALGPVFEVRPSGTTFAVPATLVYRYQPIDIAPAVPAELRMALAVGAAWSPLMTTIDASAMVVTAKTSHLSTYGLIRASQIPDASAPDGATPDASIATDAAPSDANRDATADVTDGAIRGGD
jgi:hypothetical protein